MKWHLGFVVGLITVLNSQFVWGDELRTCFTLDIDKKETPLTSKLSNIHRPESLYASSASGTRVLVAVFDSKHVLLSQAPPQWLSDGLDYFSLADIDSFQGVRILLTCLPKEHPNNQTLDQLIAQEDWSPSKSRALYLMMTKFVVAEGTRTFGTPAQGSSSARPGTASSNPSSDDTCAPFEGSKGGNKKASRRRNNFFSWLDVADHHKFKDGQPFTQVFEFQTSKKPR